MKRVKRFTFRRIALFCFLACFCAGSLNSAGAQSDRQAGENIPGVPAGYTIIEGDIQMPIGVVNAMRSQAQLTPDAPQATFITANFWPNGVVPFEFDGNCGAGSTTCVSAANQTAMLGAMTVLENVANVNFQQCANNACRGDFVHIQASNANNSAVGKQGGRQIINITSWGSRFTIVHELLHCLGLFHEHTRGDRKNYVDVEGFCKNVQGGCMGATYTSNFPISNGSAAYGFYDFDSVMHYGQCAFSSNSNCPNISAAFPDGGITIKVKPPYDTQWQAAIGQSGSLNHLSDVDRLTISFLYQQPNWRFVDATYTGGNGRSDGTFRRPYQSLLTGINATPIGGTLWIQPGTYDSPSRLTKNMKFRAPLGGVTLRPLRGASGETLAAVSAASYNGELASESIAAAFGADLAAGTVVAPSLPLPTTLGGVTVKVQDSEGTERSAPLFYVSPGQINYLVPAGTSVGVASVAVFKGSARAAIGTVAITVTAPALFTANATGQGVPAAIVLRVRGDAQFVESPFRFDAARNQFVPTPIDLGPEGDQVFLILFGTGFRAADSLSAFRVTIGGQSAEVLFAGAAPGFAGLDQANVALPRSLAGKGEVSVQFSADNRSANAVTINIR
jgi:uncharacterized protein (TIGR03437 family)